MRRRKCPGLTRRKCPGLTRRKTIVRKNSLIAKEQLQMKWCSNDDYTDDDEDYRDYYYDYTDDDEDYRDYYYSGDNDPMDYYLAQAFCSVERCRYCLKMGIVDVDAYCSSRVTCHICKMSQRYT